MGDITVGTRFRISAGFASGEEPIDPSILELEVVYPGREPHVFFQPDVQRKDKGLYFMEAVAQEPGEVIYRWRSKAIGEEFVSEGMFFVDPETIAEVAAPVVANEDWFNRAFDEFKSAVRERRERQVAPQRSVGEIALAHVAAANTHRQTAASFRSMNDATRARFHEKKARNHEIIVRMLRIV